jgi:hypothetical protein
VGWRDVAWEAENAAAPGEAENSEKPCAAAVFCESVCACESACACVCAAIDFCESAGACVGKKQNMAANRAMRNPRRLAGLLCMGYLLGVRKICARAACERAPA